MRLKDCTAREKEGGNSGESIKRFIERDDWGGGWGGWRRDTEQKRKGAEMKRDECETDGVRGRGGGGGGRAERRRDSVISDWTAADEDWK